MAQRRSFDMGYLKQEFDKISAIVKRPLSLYLIGGGAMAFYGRRTSFVCCSYILVHLVLRNELSRKILKNAIA